MACMQWGMVSHTFPWWGIGEDRMVLEEDMSPVHSGGLSVRYVPGGVWGR